MAALALTATGGVLIPTRADAATACRRQPHKVRHVHGARSRYIEPVYELRERMVTIPAVYEDRTRRVWHEPVYEQREVRIEHPAVVVTRPVARYIRGVIVGYDDVREVIKPARVEIRTESVLVREGYWETVHERVCVRMERTKVVTERVLVREGRWVRDQTPNVHRRGSARRAHGDRRGGVRVVVHRGR